MAEPQQKKNPWEEDWKTEPQTATPATPAATSGKKNPWEEDWPTTPTTTVPLPRTTAPPATTPTTNVPLPKLKIDEPTVTSETDPLNMLRFGPNHPYSRQDLIKTYRLVNPAMAGLNDNQVFAHIAQKYPRMAKGITELTQRFSGYRPPGVSPAGVATDQLANVIYGPVAFAQQLPAIAEQLARLGWQVGTGKGAQALPQIGGMLQSTAEPFVTTGLQGAELLESPKLGFQNQRDLGRMIAQASPTAGRVLGIPTSGPGTPTPDDPRTKAAAQAAGINLAATLTPFVWRGGKWLLTKPALTAEEINSWMNVPGTTLKRGRLNPGKLLQDEGLLGATKEATEANVKPALKAIAQELDQKLTASPVHLDAETIVKDEISKAQRLLGKSSDAAFQRSLKTLETDIRRDFGNIDRLWAPDAHRLKVQLGDSIRWRGEAFDDPINQVKVGIYDRLNTELKAQVPGTADLQVRYGNLHVAAKALDDSIAQDIAGRGTGAKVPSKSRPATELVKKHGLKALGVEEAVRYLRSREH